MRRIGVVVAVLLALFVLGTVFVALFQDSIGWGWWWTLPVGAGFVLAVLGFRVLAQRVDEHTRALDARLDAEERDSRAGAREAYDGGHGDDSDPEVPPQAR